MIKQVTEIEDDGAFIHYVLFSRYRDVNSTREVLLFVEEFEDNDDAEERKAKLNREMPKDFSHHEVAVGRVNFFQGDKEWQDSLVVYPKNDSKPFYWGEMINVQSVVDMAEGVENG